MKVLLLAAAIAGTITANAQVAGIRVSGGRSYRSLSGDDFTRASEGAGRSWSVGGYYDAPIYGRIGFSTGLNFLRMIDKPDYGLRPGSAVRVNRSLLELPAYLSFRLSPRRVAVWDLHVLGGYSMARVIGAGPVAGQSGLGVPFGDAVSSPLYHLANFGFEAGYRFRAGQTISIGLQQRLGGRTVMSGYEKVNDYSLIVKAGLRTKRAAPKYE